MFKPRLFLTFLGLTIFVALAQGQSNTDSGILDSVYLKSGKLYEGVVSEHVKGQYLRMKKQDGKEVIIGDIDIARVIDNNQDAPAPNDVFQVDKTVREDEEAQKEEPTRSKQNKVLDLVYLTDGSLLKGEIVEYKQDEFIRIILTSGTELKISSGEIERIRQQLPGEEKEPAAKEKKSKEKKKPVMAENKGWYNVTYLASYNGRVDGEFKMGLGLQNIVGYQFNQFLGLGIGVGLDAQALDGSETLYPVYAEFRGYFSKRVKSPYYSVSAGYNFAFKNRKRDITEAKGGYLIHPAIGFRLAEDTETNVLIDIGYRFQQATFTRVIPFDDKLIKEIDYRRFTVRLGLIF